MHIEDRDGGWLCGALSLLLPQSFAYCIFTKTVPAVSFHMASTVNGRSVLFIAKSGFVMSRRLASYILKIDHSDAFRVPKVE